MSKLRWGVLSTAAIARRKVIPALQSSDTVEVVAIASRDLGAARAAAGEAGIARAYGSYAELLADADVDVVYNPLPNDLHVPLTLQAARAGKHVLCEKPFALRAAELDVLLPWARRVHLREAFMIEHHPQWIAARDSVERGELGELLGIDVHFSYFNSDPSNIRNRREAGGGALYDIGCYAVFAGAWFFGMQARRAVGSFARDPRFGIDRHACGLLDYGDGRHLRFSVSTQSTRHQRVVLVGSRARLAMDLPFNPPPDFDSVLRIDGELEREIHVAAADQYRLQAEAMARDIVARLPDERGVLQARERMQVLDALWRSEASGAFEAVAG